jgi:hypothetical protein
MGCWSKHASPKYFKLNKKNTILTSKKWPSNDGVSLVPCIVTMQLESSGSADHFRPWRRYRTTRRLWGSTPHAHSKHTTSRTCLVHRIFILAESDRSRLDGINSNRGRSGAAERGQMHGSAVFRLNQSLCLAHVSPGLPRKRPPLTSKHLRACELVFYHSP